MNCTLPLALFVWKSTEMDTEKFVYKKCSFTTEKLEKLNTHTKKIHVIHNVSNTANEKPLLQTIGDQTEKEKNGLTFVRVHDIVRRNFLHRLPKMDIFVGL